MNSSAEALELSRCEACQSSFLPTAGPCPRCGAVSRASVLVPPVGIVLASTDVLHPPAGWAVPHRLALVEVSGGVLLLAIVDGDLPSAGSAVAVRAEGETYRAHPRNAAP